MEAIPTKFKIRDLEEFSGVKSHTIRMWEKRFGLLKPERTDTNIRTYSHEDLKTILNVAFLNNRGHKISRIAVLSPSELDQLVLETASKGDPAEDALNALKIATLTYDEATFTRVTKPYTEQFGAKALVEQIFMPLLEHIGVLWHSNAICPAQEHFVTNIVRKELILAADRAKQETGIKQDKTYVLLLPDRELHELGLLYVRFLLSSAGYRTIYLGQCVPVADLVQVTSAVQGPLTVLMSLTSDPSSSGLGPYLERLRADIPDPRVDFVITGAPVMGLKPKDIPSGFEVHPTVSALNQKLFAA